MYFAMIVLLYYVTISCVLQYLTIHYNCGHLSQNIIRHIYMVFLLRQHFVCSFDIADHSRRHPVIFHLFFLIKNMGAKFKIDNAQIHDENLQNKEGIMLRVLFTMEENTSLTAPGALAHCLQRHKHCTD